MGTMTIQNKIASKQACYEHELRNKVIRKLTEAAPCAPGLILPSSPTSGDGGI
jgi:hypothetical protein